jgi:hypothetical protein
MVCREDVVAVGLRSNRRCQALGQLVDHSIEIEPDQGQQIVLRAGDRASDDPVRGERDAGRVEQG